MTAANQLALPFPHEPDYARTEFVPAPSNAAARTWLARTEHWPGGRLALWGDAGCGKTHLLHRWTAQTGATLIGGPALQSLPNLPVLGGVAIDEADTAEEEALLHLLNAAAEAALPVLLASRPPPARWTVRLPDLASRLRSVHAVDLGRAEGDLLRALLAARLSGRQLDVPAPLQEWLLLRLPRTPAAIREAATRLDRAALAAGAGVTRSLVAQVLADLTAEVRQQNRETTVLEDIAP